MASKKQDRRTISRLNLPIFLVALFGVLLVVHLWIQVDRGFTHGCLGFSAPSGEIAECAAVVGSEFGKTFGVSNVLLGLAFFGLIGVLRFGVVASRPPLAVKLQRASLYAVGAGMLFALYLAYVQVVQLDEYCVLCLISGGTTALLLGLHVAEWRGVGVRPPGEGRPFSMSLRPYGAGLMGLLVLAAADVGLSRSADGPVAFETTGDGDPTLAELSEGCLYDQQLETFTLFDLQASRAAYRGGRDGGARALKIFDPNCPHCATLHAQMKPVLPEYADDLRVYYQPIALWDISVPQVQAMYIAREQGSEKFLEMMEMQFDRRIQGGTPVDTLVAWAGEIGLDEEAFRADIQRGKYVDLIRSERTRTMAAGVNSVPRLIFEGRPIHNSQLTWTSECLRYYSDSAVRGS